MKSTTKFWLILIAIIIALGMLLDVIIIESQWALEEYKIKNPQPVCNDTTNETITSCYELNHSGNSSYGGYVIYSGFVF